jgi:hypothetical protein
VASWFTRSRQAAETLRLKPRREPVTAERVNLADLAPALMPYLGQCACIQLEQFQTLARVVDSMPQLEAREGVTAAAGMVLAKHQSLVAEIKRHGGDPAEVMGPFAVELERFRHVTGAAEWQMSLLGAHVTGGLLDDFFIRLSEGLPSDVGPRTAQLLGSDSGDTTITGVLRSEIAADPQLASRLAMWGRRLVGDTLLVARSALHGSGDAQSDELRIEPVLTEIIGAHTRRMDALGLTA